MIAAQANPQPAGPDRHWAICNIGCIIEHECVVGALHIGPGAVLCGNVQVGDGSFVGANAVVRQGIRIGRNAMIGGRRGGEDVPDGTTVVGVPARQQ